MISEMQLILFLNNYSPALLKLAYYVSQSLYVFVPMIVLLIIKTRGIKSGIYSIFVVALISALSFELKLLFDIPRPSNDGIRLLEHETDGSFPSGHAIGSFGAAAISGYRILYVWAFLISVSRLVLGVHYLRDIVAGALLGIVIGRLAMKYESRMIYAFFDSAHAFETRRKVFHGVFGTIIALFVYFVPKDIAAGILLLSVAATYLISRALKKRINVPVLGDAVNAFERKKDIENFPLKGTLFFLLGALVSVLLYEKNIAAASIIILALGDCLSTLIGKPFGKTRHPHNVEKSVEGSAAGFLAALGGALIFVPVKIAVTGALAGMIIESFNLKFFGISIDDNLSVPVICGAVMAAAVTLSI